MTERTSPIEIMYESVAEFWDTFMIETGPPGMQLAKNCINEEWRELMAAREPVDILDALCDLEYVLLGLDVATRKKPNFEKTPRFASAMPFPSSLAGEIDKIMNPAQVDPQTAYYHNRVTAAVVLCAGAIGDLGIQPLPPFMEVHRSNMTKIWSADEIENVDKNEYNVFPIRGMFMKYVVKRKTDGKIIKPASYSPANLKQFFV